MIDLPCNVGELVGYEVAWCSVIGQGYCAGRAAGLDDGQFECSLLFFFWLDTVFRSIAHKCGSFLHLEKRLDAAELTQRLTFWTVSLGVLETVKYCKQDMGSVCYECFTESLVGANHEAGSLRIAGIPSCTEFVIYLSVIPVLMLFKLIAVKNIGNSGSAGLLMGSD